MTETSRRLHERLWAGWKAFWYRVGSVQTRLILSVLFFVLVAPFAMGVKIFSDPLRIKDKGNESHWLPRIKSNIGLEESQRQF